MRKKVLLVVVGLLAAVTVLAISGCSCSAQSSSSASASASTSAAASSSASASSSSSSAATQAEVPNLMMLSQADAEKALKDVGLAVGDVTQDYSDTIPSGCVMAQSPDALTKVDAGTKVSFTISQGKQAPVQVAVPDLIGMGQYDAENALAAVGLVAVEYDPIVSSEVDPGLVCWQSIDVGAMVDEGTQVAFSTALAEDQVEVPNLIGDSFSGASDELTQLGLGCDQVNAYSDKDEPGIVMAQDIDTGTWVDVGTVVTLTVSLGPAPSDKVTVPNCYTYTKSEAEATLVSAGLLFNVVGDEDGTVIAMYPEQGTQVDVGTTVTILLQ